ncbi:MAG: APC family permease [Myxococcota bacterium]|nr:APC family permease [Myxococcota bacterium]
MSGSSISSPHLVRHLTLFSMVMAVITSTIGSGWLFAPYFAARMAGPASLVSWVIGGLMAFALALVFAELGALLSTSGSLAQIPLLSHGRFSGFIGGWSAWLAYVSLPAIEVMATMEYLSSSLPFLTDDRGGVQVLTTTGMGLAVLLLVLFAWINLAGVIWLARWIDGLTVWKVLIPVATSLILILTASHWENLSPFMPTRIEESGGVLRAISAGGILFSLLGFRTAMDLAGEARNPQRNVPLAMAIGLGVSLVIYILLQFSFLVAVPPELLEGGWGRLALAGHGGPLVAIVSGLGLTWLVTVLLVDAAISPSATSMAYMGAAARVNWMLSRCGLLPEIFGKTNKAAVPSVALLSSLAIGVLILRLPAGWEGVVNFLTTTLVIALSVGPVSLWSLREQWPDRPRPYRLPFSRPWCVASFILASWAVFWSGWETLGLAALAIAVPSLGFVLIEGARGRAVQWRGGMWWFVYLGGLTLLSGLIGDGRPYAWPMQWQLLGVAVFALAVFPIAIRSRLKQVAPEATLMLASD